MKKLFLTAIALLALGGGNLNAAVSLTYVADSYNNNRLVDGNRGVKWEGSASSDMWCIFKTSVPIQVTSYVLTTGGDNSTYPGRNWKDWTVFGGNFASDDAAKSAARSTEGGWVALDVRQNDDILQDQNTADFEFTMNQPDTENYYTYYLVKATSTKGNPWMQMGEFAFKDYTIDTSAYDGVIASAKSFDTSAADAALRAEYATLVGTLDNLKAAAASSGNFDELDAALTNVNKLQVYINGYASSSYVILSSVGETWGDGAAANLLDGNKNTKWGGNFSKGNIVWRLKEGIVPLYYQLTAGGDTGSNTGRNWKSWAIYGGNFSSALDATTDASDWVELYSTEDGGMTTESGVTQDFDFQTTIIDIYQYFMVVAHNTEGGQTQMADLNIIDASGFNANKAASYQELVDFQNKYDYSEATDEQKNTFDNAVTAVGASTYKNLTENVAAAWAAEKAMADYLASDEKFGAESVNISSGLDADVFTRKTPVEGGVDIIEGFDNDQTGFYTKTITVDGTARTTNYGVPDDGILKTSSGHTYAFDYDSYNAVFIKKDQTKTMTLDGERQSKSWRFYFLGTASNGPADMTATFNYQDGTTSQAQFQIYNWDTNNEETRAVTVYQTGRVDLWHTDNIQDNQNFRFFEIPVFVDQNKVITSISLYNSGVSNGNSKAMVFGFCIVGKDDSAEMFYMGSNGYATYVPEVKDVDLSGFDEEEELAAYTVSIAPQGWATLTKVTEIPAGSAVVMKGKTGSYKLPYTTGAAALTGNELQASDVDITADGTQYVLAKGAEGVGFYKAAENSVIAANKGYLVIAGGEVKGFYGFAPDGTTGIEAMDGAQQSDVQASIYNLAGQRVGRMQNQGSTYVKGIYIVDGKKKVIK